MLKPTKKLGMSILTEVELNKMYRYSLSLIKNADEAWDLLQNSLEKFLKKNEGSQQYPIAYLYRIIKNNFIDEMRRQSRWRCEEFEEKPSHNAALLDPEMLSRELVSKEETQIILQHLNPEERELLYLWAVDGYTVQEIAEQTNTPKGTLLSKLHRIKKKLRPKLKQENVVEFRA